MKRIVLTTFYFGEEPWYFKYFIQSCIANKDIDFIFFTDIKNIDSKLDNFKVIEVGVNEFSTTISNFLNIDLDVKRPVKFCDIRPSFGEVFQNLIKDYDYWGYCDIDIVFGKIRNFLDDNVLSSYDVIFSKHEYPSGFFAIYKNNFTVNSLYRSSNDYVKIFQSEHLYLFDECGGHYDEVCNGINILDTDYEFDSMHHILEKNKDKIKVHYEFYSLEASVGKIKYENGILTYNDQFEILLYHFTTFKKNYFFNEKKEKMRKSKKDFYIGNYEISQIDYCSIFINRTINFLKPLIVKMFMKFDFHFSNITKKTNSNFLLKSGEYKYMKRVLIVECISNEYYLIYPNKEKNKLYFLSYHGNIFFEKNKSQFYLMSDFSNNLFTSFNKIFDNGSVMKYSNKL